AGQDTVSAAITWTLILIARNPATEHRIRGEIEGIEDGKKPTYSEIQDLAFLTNVCRESLRLYPPIWCMGLRALDNDRIGGISVTKGELVEVLPYVMHRHPDYWANPEKFIPER